MRYEKNKFKKRYRLVSVIYNDKKMFCIQRKRLKVTGIFKKKKEIVWEYVRKDAFGNELEAKSYKEAYKDSSKSHMQNYLEKNLRDMLYLQEYRDGKREKERESRHPQNSKESDSWDNPTIHNY